MRRAYRPAGAGLLAAFFSFAKMTCRITNMIHGYARVSTDGQSLDAHAEQLSAAPVARRCFANGERGQDRSRAATTPRLNSNV
jgi:hypothetical protein